MTYWLRTTIEKEVKNMKYYQVTVIGENSVFDDNYAISANSIMEVESDVSTHYCGNDFALAQYTITEITEQEYLTHEDRRKF